MRKLINYIIKEPIHQDKMFGHKFPFNAAEVLCSENPIILNKFFEKSSQFKRFVKSNTMDFRSSSLCEGVDTINLKNLIPELTTKHMNSLNKNPQSKILETEQNSDDEEKSYVLSDLQLFDENSDDENSMSKFTINEESKPTNVNKKFILIGK